jgi:hypothetical protein
MRNDMHRCGCRSVSLSPLCFPGIVHQSQLWGRTLEDSTDLERKQCSSAVSGLLVAGSRKTGYDNVRKTGYDNVRKTEYDNVVPAKALLQRCPR